MIDFKLGGTYQIQHVLSGSGVFDGTPVGYAKYTYNVAGVSFTLRRRRLGTEGNTLPVRVVVPAKDNPGIAVRYNGSEIAIYLKKVGGSIVSSAADVVHAVNYPDPARVDTRWSDLISAGVVTDGTLTAGDTGTFTGGLDPTSVGAKHMYAPATNTHGGMFYFENENPWLLNSIDCRFTTASGVAVSGRIVNVTDALTMVTNEEAAIWEVTTVDNYASFGAADHVIMPGQALVVIAASAGMVRVCAREEARRSYL